jgi:hypothetical protein
VSDDDPEAVQPLWNEALISPAERAGRPDALPRQGVIWITLGEIRIDARQSVHAKKGDVVAYADDGSLRFTTAGARVRWSARDVDAPPGEARPWTEALSRDLPTGPPRPQPVNPRRRALVATAAWILSAWAIALLVACSPSQEPAPAPSATSAPAPANPTATPNAEGSAELDVAVIDRLMKAVEQRRKPKDGSKEGSKDGSNAAPADGTFTAEQIDYFDGLMHAVEQRRQSRAEQDRLHDVLTRAGLTLTADEEKAVLTVQRDYQKKRQEIFSGLGMQRRGGAMQSDADRSEFRSRLEELQVAHEANLRAALAGMEAEKVDRIVAAFKQSYPGFFPRDRPASPAMGGNETPAPMNGEPTPKEPGK